jgi:hypothetical protein
MPAKPYQRLRRMLLNYTTEGIHVLLERYDNPIIVDCSW